MLLARIEKCSCLTISARLHVIKYAVSYEKRHQALPRFSSFQGESLGTRLTLYIYSTWYQLEGVGQLASFAVTKEWTGNEAGSTFVMIMNLVSANWSLLPRGECFIAVCVRVCALIETFYMYMGVPFIHLHLHVHGSTIYTFTTEDLHFT